MHFGVGTLKINQSLEALFTFCFYINNCLTYVCLADKHQTACARWPLSNVNILLIEAILSQGIFYFRKTFYVDGIEANSNCLCGGRLDYSATQPPICHRSCWAWRIFIRKNNSRRHVQLFRIKTKIAKLGDGDSANVTHKHTHRENNFRRQHFENLSSPPPTSLSPEKTVLKVCRDKRREERRPQRRRILVTWP